MSLRQFRAQCHKPGKQLKAAAPVPAPAFLHYIARPVNGRIAGRKTYSYFDEVCQAAADKANIMFCNIEVVAVHEGKKYRLARTLPGGRFS